jgi:hypothetical protein
MNDKSATACDHGASLCTPPDVSSTVSVVGFKLASAAWASSQDNAQFKVQQIFTSISLVDTCEELANGRKATAVAEVRAMGKLGALPVRTRLRRADPERKSPESQHEKSIKQKPPISSFKTQRLPHSLSDLQQNGQRAAATAQRMQAGTHGLL